MKKTIEVIWKFINSKFFGYAVAALLIVILASQCRRIVDLKQDIIKIEQNIAAADSTITEYKTKEGAYIAEKAIWILTEKELKEQNTILFNEVKKQSGKVIALNKSVLSLIQDTTILHDSISFLHAIIEQSAQINESDWLLPWKLEYKWDATNYDLFWGHTIARLDTVTNKIIHVNTLLDVRNSQIDLTFGEKIVDGKYNVFVTSNYPGLTTSSLQGVLIDPNTNKDIRRLIEKKHWFTGFSLSIGMTPGYDFLNNRATIVIGPSIGYTIYQW